MYFFCANEIQIRFYPADKRNGKNLFQDVENYFGKIWRNMVLCSIYLLWRILWMSLFSFGPIFVDWSKLTHSLESKFVDIMLSFKIHTENCYLLGTKNRGLDPPQKPRKVVPHDLFIKFREVSIAYLQLVRLANRWSVQISCPVPFLTWRFLMLRPVFPVFEFWKSRGSSTLLQVGEFAAFYQEGVMQLKSSYNNINRDFY